MSTASTISYLLAAAALGGVIASVASTVAANRQRQLDREHDRQEKFREWQVAACADFISAMNEARSFLIFAHGKAGKLIVQRATPEDGDEAWLLMQECRFKIEEAIGHGTRLVLVSPYRSLDKPVQAHLNAANACRRSVHDFWADRGHPGPDALTVDDAFETWREADAAFQLAARKVIHGTQERCPGGLAT